MIGRTPWISLAQASTSPSPCGPSMAFYLNPTPAPTMKSGPEALPTGFCTFTSFVGRGQELWLQDSPESEPAKLTLIFQLVKVGTHA